MVARQRHLGGADQVEVVGLEPVDLVGVRAEKAGAAHDLGPHQHRRDHQREAVVDRHPRRELQQPQLQQRAPAGQEVEPRAGDLGAALHVDQPQRLAEFEMVPGVVDSGGFADGVQHDEVVLAAGGHTVDDDVGDGHVGGRERLLGGGLPGFGVLDPVGQLLGLCEDRRPLVRRGRTDLLAHRLLFGPHRVGGRDRAATGGIGRQQVVHERRVLAAAELRTAHGVRVFPQQLQVDHGLNPTFVGFAPTVRVPGSADPPATS